MKGGYASGKRLQLGAQLQRNREITVAGSHSNIHHTKVKLSGAEGAGKTTDPSVFR